MEDLVRLVAGGLGFGQNIIMAYLGHGYKGRTPPQSLEEIYTKETKSEVPRGTTDKTKRGRDAPHKYTWGHIYI